MNCLGVLVLFFHEKTAYELMFSEWNSKQHAQPDEQLDTRAHKLPIRIQNLY